MAPQTFTKILDPASSEIRSPNPAPEKRERLSKDHKTVSCEKKKTHQQQKL
jgi:hypothetical protein